MRVSYLKWLDFDERSFNQEVRYFDTLNKFMYHSPSY